MIVILHRDDLPLRSDRKRTAASLELYHFSLSREILNYAAAIVFVEGQVIKFLKAPEGVNQNVHQRDVLEQLMFALQPAPEYRGDIRDINIKDLGQRRDHGNYRRRKV